ncbi:sulfotransferase [Actinoplanes sp. L3-i22]|uniref:sulfotransferase family protein n=1 Tax=Actinoplanes sp. L3-i22 TaxID=2836373 RepID=UPI001C77E73D|nr:sulfotransferase [Actinoplanes sp. L3-i22]BCY09664.1 sulfotransferase family protein [Actinoplanes sp. L3-i22]
MTAEPVREGGEIRPPLLILAPSRSFTTVVCAMLGQHPRLYGLPEVNLLCDRTMAERAARMAKAAHPMDGGLLRAVGQLWFGGQTAATVRRARTWLDARADLTTAAVFRELAQRLDPRTVVEKSPSTVLRPRNLRRAHREFPQARFLHLVRHPRGHGESVLRAAEGRRRSGPVRPDHWLARLAAHPSDRVPGDGVPGPHNAWYLGNATIVEFLRSVPADAQLRIRGEALLAEPDTVLPRIADWLGLPADAAAIEAMKHPETSPYAFVGPPGARFGGDVAFLREPALRSAPAPEHRLDGPLSWAPGGQEFPAAVKAMAAEFGYT